MGILRKDRNPGIEVSEKLVQLRRPEGESKEGGEGWGKIETQTNSDVNNPGLPPGVPAPSADEIQMKKKKRRGIRIRG